MLSTGSVEDMDCQSDELEKEFIYVDYDTFPHGYTCSNVYKQIVRKLILEGS